jgi:glycosyltransferase involved in cell wall biosynthesis
MLGHNPVVNVIQDGGRLHYALPIALHRSEILGTVFTDWFVQPGSREDSIARFVRRLSPDLGTRLADRCCPELDGTRVLSSNWFTLHQCLTRAYPGAAEKRDAQLSKSFARWVGRQDWRGANAMIGFVRNIDPELCAAAKKRHVVTVVDQMIAPAAIQAAEAQRQATRWPHWRGRVDAGNLDPVLDIERRTWALADHITCPSDYVREGLLQQGLASDKVSVIPYPIDSARFPFIDRRGRDGPLVVGFLGAVCSRKGAPAFIEVARRFDASKTRFVMVGPVELDVKVVAANKGQVELIGAVPRSQVLSWLERFDVLLFPSTCEGSAGAVMEAMATGLPVITTRNSGTIARDGIEGFICACDDIAGLVQCLDRLEGDPSLRMRMGAAARERARSFDLDGYGRSLECLFRKLIMQRTEPGRSAALVDARL